MVVDGGEVKRSLAVSINEIPATDAVFVLIMTSYKIFCNLFRVIRV